MAERERNKMFKHVEYDTVGVCSQKIDFDIIDGYIHHVVFTGGCGGNTKGVAALAEGLPALEVVNRCRHIPCQGDNSCPNQLAIAIEQALAEMQK